MPLWRSSKVSEDCLSIVAGPFPYEYRPSEHYRPGPPLGFRVESSGHARMIWGSTQVTCPTICRRESIPFPLNSSAMYRQEATALLAALNHLSKEGATLREVKKGALPQKHSRPSLTILSLQVGLCPLEAVGCPEHLKPTLLEGSNAPLHPHDSCLGVRYAAFGRGRDAALRRIARRDSCVSWR